MALRKDQRRNEGTGWEIFDYYYYWLRIFDYYRTTGDSNDGKLLYIQCYSSLIFNFAELEYWKFTPSFKFRSGDNGEFSRRSYYSSCCVGLSLLGVWATRHGDQPL